MVRSNLNRNAKDRRNALLSLIYLCGDNEYFLSPSETYEPLAIYFNLSDLERKETQNEREGDYRNHWEILIQNSRQQLVDKGLIDKSIREIWKLTGKGILEAKKIADGYNKLYNIFWQKPNEKIQKTDISSNLLYNNKNDDSNIKEILNITPKTDVQLLNENTVYSEDINEPSEKIISVSYRIVRDTVISQKIKKLYNYECQLCKKVLVLKNDVLYNEAHHIKPLGSPHNGPDVTKNIICVCPEHHVLLDYGAIKLNKEQMIIHPSHQISDEYIYYHNKNIFEK